MNLPITSRQTMLLAGLLQGAAMLLLHEWFRTQGFRPADLVWELKGPGANYFANILFGRPPQR